MENLFGSLTKLITPEILSSVASTLGEDKSKVSSAIGGMVPALLGAILQKGGNNKLLETGLKAAGSADLLSNVAGLFSGNSDKKIQGISSNLLGSLFGDKLGAFSSLISSASGVSNSGIGKLLSMVTPLIGGFLGNKLNSGMSMSGLLGLLGSEKSSFLSAIPKGLTDILGISSLDDLGGGVEKKLKGLTNNVAGGSKGGPGWLKWLLPLAALLFLGWWLLNKSSCAHHPQNIEGTTETVVEDINTNIQNELESVHDGINRVSKEITLPSGLKLNGFEGGIEEQMAKFLTSDDYKKATPENLKEKWFNFDAINFKFGSGTELTPESETQLKNVGEILKEFKNAKIKIGAYTDKKGDNAANLKVSQERANTIKEKLSKGGLGSQITGAEGYGSQFAKVDANASDEARAKDRKIAIRFEK